MCVGFPSSKLQLISHELGDPSKPRPSRVQSAVVVMGTVWERGRWWSSQLFPAVEREVLDLAPLLSTFSKTDDQIRKGRQNQRIFSFTAVTAFTVILGFLVDAAPWWPDTDFKEEGIHW